MTMQLDSCWPLESDGSEGILCTYLKQQQQQKSK